VWELSFVRPSGFDITDIAVPTQIMVARDDEMIPATHGRWLADHIPRCRTRDRPGHPPRIRPPRRRGKTYSVASQRLIKSAVLMRYQAERASAKFE
jgi:pimeloyl-ACP methyl ester carboxylesterase